MKRWFARRFKYVRDLERLHRKDEHALDAMISTVDVLEALLKDCQQRRMEIGKMTLEECETLLTGVVDYQRCLRLLAAADPVQDKVLPIFEKYNIKVVRNTRGDILSGSKERTTKEVPKRSPRPATIPVEITPYDR